jgi:hypothetical protein
VNKKRFPSNVGVVTRVESIDRRLPLQDTDARSLFRTLFDGAKMGHHYLAWNQFRRVSSIFRIEIARNKMKRIIHTLIFLAVSVDWASPQQPMPSSTVTDDEFQKVLKALSNEDWDTAVGLSAKYLKQMKTEDLKVERKLTKEASFS